MTEFQLRKRQGLTTPALRQAVLDKPGFGEYFTDHMSHVRYTQDQGWHAHEVIPLSLIHI